MIMKRTALLIQAALLLSLASVSAAAQDENVNGIPNDVYYLMPQFGTGYVYFSGQAPVKGQINICAVDNTLRYMDKGKEIVADAGSNVLKVVIDDVWFIHSGGLYFRMYPVTDIFGFALKREVNIRKDIRLGSTMAGMARSNAIIEYGSVYPDGEAHGIDQTGNNPYTVSEKLFMYIRDKVVPINKKNLQKLFPDKKVEIKNFFVLGNYFPDDPEEAKKIISGWL